MSAIVRASRPTPPHGGGSGRGVLFDMGAPPPPPPPPGGNGPWWLLAGMSFLAVLVAAVACTWR